MARAPKSLTGEPVAPAAVLAPAVQAEPEPVVEPVAPTDLTTGEPPVPPAEPVTELVPGPGEVVVSLHPDDTLNQFTDGQTHLLVTKVPARVRAGLIGKDCRARRPAMCIVQHKE